MYNCTMAKFGMTTIIREFYEALKEAGASEEKAAAAAQAIQAVREEERLRRIEERLTRVEERLTPLQWMISFNLALSTAVLVKLLV
jgi:hypothetical protein